MRKRLILLTLILAGVLLAVATFAYWQFMSAVEDPDEAFLLETLAGLSLSQASYGSEALAEALDSYPYSGGNE